MTATGPDGEDHAYFRAIEETFVALRGAPLLLSPADWQLARRWHRAGIPLDLVRRTLAEVFARREERKAKRQLLSLRYCAPAVEAAWQELVDLTAPGHRGEAEALDVGGRLAALAAALPAQLGGRDELARRITALTGEAYAVEEALAALDRELIERASLGLAADARAEVEARIEATLTQLGSRLPAQEVARSRDRLRQQIVRRLLALPVLSLFSPEAEPKDS
jgi:hypothetical protein